MGNCNRYGISFGGNESILKLDSGNVVQLCEYTKNHWIAHFRWVKCIRHELKLNKAVLYIHIHTHKIFLFTYTSDSHSVDIFSTEILPDWKEIIFYLGNEENLID